MYSLNYGTVPLVRKVGGLADTVTDISDELEGNGFVFTKFEQEDFTEAVFRSMNLFRNKDLMRKVMLHGMNMDFSWRKSSAEYIALYESMCPDR
jgi:starch synthase